MNRFRFAPSPTGHLHIGGARTALYNFLMAKKTKGQFILRVEDTDTERSTQAFADGILSGMQWLGLTWDEGPYYQSQRKGLYTHALNQLLDEGKAYRCECSRERLDKVRETALQKGEKPKYDGHCRNLNLQHSETPYCIRFKSQSAGQTTVEDLIKGTVVFNNEELDDFIIARTDGSPTYNFVVVVDDVDLRITHVIRGDDHLNNTPRQVQLYHALSYKLPKFAHVPMILGADKKRLSKRHGATSVLAYQEMGYLPQSLVNYLVRLGWSCGDQEIFSLEELITSFDIKDVGKSAGVFNPEKLLWLNGHYLRNSDIKSLFSAAGPFFEKQGIALQKDDYTFKVLTLCQEKVKTLEELAGYTKFFFCAVTDYEENAKQKFLDKTGKEILSQIFHTLKALEDFSTSSLESVLKELAEARGLKFKLIAQPLRVALSGGVASPSIFEVIDLLGKENTLQRIQNAIAQH